VQENSRKTNGREFIMKTYVVYYNHWDTMEIYHVGQDWERAYEMVEYNADIYGESVTYLQTWVDGILHK
jgi:hypothetical protein